jgi:hypothetical protein
VAKGPPRAGRRSPARYLRTRAQRRSGRAGHSGAALGPLVVRFPGTCLVGGGSTVLAMILLALTVVSLWSAVRTRSAALMADHSPVS